MGRLILLFAAGYVVGRMSTGQSMQQALQGGVSDLKNLFGRAQAMLPKGQPQTPAGVTTVEPSWHEDSGY